LIWPYTCTVALVDSGCTIRRRPFGSTLDTGCSIDGGNCKVANSCAAQAGSTTGLSGLEAKLSAPPKPLPATGLPELSGVRIAVTAWAGSNVALASAFTAAGVTAMIACFIASGDASCSNASACDHALASPSTEFFWNSSAAIALCLAASISAGSIPLPAASARMDCIRASTGCGLPPFGKIPIA